MTQIWVLYRQSGSDRLEKQPTDLRQYTCYFGDRTLGCQGRLGASDDLRKVSGIQARPTDKRAIDILLAHQLLGVIRLNAPAVLDPNPVSGSSIGELGQNGTNKGVRLFGLGRRGGSPRSNGPAWLISHNDFGVIFLRYSFQTAAHLPLQNLLHLLAIPFVKRFTDTKNGAKTGIQCRSNLSINDLVCFTEQ